MKRYLKSFLCALIAVVFVFTAAVNIVNAGKYPPDIGNYSAGKWEKWSGKWYYKASDGTYVTGYSEIDGTRYLFDSKGKMLTGWQQADGYWYYFKSSGAGVTGWQKISKKWYYFGFFGEMWTGLQGISNASKTDIYYFGSDGAMKTGWQKIGSSWYYFASSGAAATGWQKISSKWYYFRDNGEMCTGLMDLDDGKYLLNSSGAMVTGWQKVDGAWYYFESSGKAVVNTTKRISGKNYSFDENGVWIENPSHTHTYAARTVIVSPAWDEVVTVTPATTERRLVTEAWDEQVPQYGTETRYITAAGRDITNIFNDYDACRADCYRRDCGCIHGRPDDDCACGAWHTETVNVITGYTTVHHDAVYETVNVPAVTQTVHHDAVTHTETYCTECGYIRH
ncbi:Glucan-binding domain-containing protein (YG repeat) [Ruminococcaceae bacterium YRB3002]|nr:Glucan-binding domain-containing protein (YG repeat) [Ruminococcaceae bacterium YRB3002]